MLKKGFSFAFIILGVLVLGGIGGVFFSSYAVPYLSSVPSLAGSNLLKQLNDRVTIINKTEQVVIREDDSIEKIVSQPATAVVDIVRLPDAEKKEEKIATKVSAKTIANAETSQTAQSTSMTGVLLTNDGMVVTYSEQPFADESAKYAIILFDGTSHDANFIGRDSLTNLDFFRLNDSSDTAAISFANSDDARIGKKLIAIGNAPAAYQNRLALGTLGNIDHTFNLSSSSKTVASSEKWEGVFEMDFGTPGDFVGGPAVDFNGEMLGVIGSVSFNNTMRTFVIPANTVHDSLKKAIAGTLSDRPVLGVYYRSVTDTLALSEGLPRSVGALIAAPSAVGGKAVAAILADSPASRAGLQAGDIIESVGGTDIDLEHPLSQLVGNYTKGSQVDFHILRNGEEKTVTVGL